MNWKYNPKTKGSGIITCIPQRGICPNQCEDCFFQSGRSYLEPLKDNLPHIPSKELADGRIVRMNDGNDSNIQRELVEKTARLYKDYFYNTAIPDELEKFDAPVVLTINPGKMTNEEFYCIKNIPNNLMFVRFRTNAWNIPLCNLAVKHYTSVKVPVVLTFMAYYTQSIPLEFQCYYEWKQRTLNSYWVLKDEKRKNIIDTWYVENELVYSCGYKNTHSCQRCGNCIREYYNTKERMRI